MRFLPAFLLCLLALASAAQKIPSNPNQVVNGKRDGKWTILVDKDWNEVQSPTQTAFYRVIEFKQGVPQGISRDYFLSGKVQWEGHLASVNPDVNDGLCVWYDEQGTKTKELTYKNGLLNGKAIYYYQGKKYSEGTYNLDLANLDWVYYGNDYTSYYETGRQWEKLENYPKAEESYQKAIDITIKELGPNSTQLGNTYWNLGYVYKNLDQPGKALTSYLKVLSIYKSVKGAEDDIKAFIVFTEDMADYQASAKKLESSIRLYKVAIAERQKYKFTTDQNYYWDLKHTLDYSYNLGRHDSIDYYFGVVASIIPLSESGYVVNLRDWASYAIAQKAYEKFDRIEKNCEAYFRERDQKNERDSPYAIALTTYGRLLGARGQTQRAIKSFTDARTILEPIKLNHRESYLKVFHAGAQVYNAAKKYDAIAIEWFDVYEKSNELWSADSGDLYSDGLVDIINYYVNTKNYAKAEPMIRKALAIVEREKGTKDGDFISLNVLLAGVLERMGKVSESQAIVSTITKEDEQTFIKQAGLEQSMKEADELGRVLKSAEYAKAIKLFESNSEIISSQYIKTNDYSALLELNLAMAYVYRETGNLARAQELLLSANKIALDKLGKTHPTTILAMWNLGEFYQRTGNLSGARGYYSEALRALDETRTEANKKENNEQFYGILARLASVYVTERRYEEAENTYYDVLYYYEKTYGADSEEYAGTNKSLGDLYQSMRRYALAGEIYAKVKPVIRKSGENSPSYVNLCESMALNYQVRGKYDQVEALYLKAKDFYGRTLGTKSASYIHVLSELAVFYYHTQAWAKADAAFTEINQLSIYKIDNFFASLSEQEKGFFYASEQRTFNKYNSFAIHYAGKNPAEAGEMYNLQLTTKGLLFRATNKVKETIISGNDVALKDLYMKWLTKKELLAKVYQMSDDEKKASGVNERKEEESVNAIEKELTSRSEQFAILLNPSPDWKQIQKKLKPGEAAVEIVRVIDAYPSYEFDYVGKGINYDSVGEGARIYEIISDRSPAHKAGLHEGDMILEINGQRTKGKTFDQLGDLLGTNPAKLKIKREGKDAAIMVSISADSVFRRIYANPAIYAALILTPETTQPELVLLSNGDQMEQRYIKFYRNAIKSKLEDPYSYNIYWKPIREKLKGSRTIYFSPDGIYNSININTLFNTETGKYVLDEVELKLVSNTAELLQSIRPSDATQVVLVGFPDYNKLGSSVSAVNLSSALDFKLLKSDTSQRFMNGTNVTELPGTQVEVNTIEQIFKTGKSGVSKWVAQQASEENIKGLHSPKVLHIATHGFFMDDVPASANQRGITGVSVGKLRENPLLRSGLLLAGAGKTINSGNENSKSEDGILTAYEAMNLDLQKTELVVLSACETGLGQVRAGEGVYGLQRAFRAAGAQSVLMSLWKVDDQSTQQLMTEFYQQWQTSNDRRASFRQAQQKLREKYKHPYYWGAFVMVGN